MSNDNQNNPYAAPQEPIGQFPQINTGNTGGKLGNLAQSAQVNNLRNARIWMVVIGLLLIIPNVIEFVNAREMLLKEARRQFGNNLQVDENELNKLVKFVQVIDGAVIALGVCYLAMAFFIYQKPVIITMTALGLFILLHVAIAFFNPMYLVQGWLLKIFAIAGLWKSIDSARAYERERTLQLAQY